MELNRLIARSLSTPRRIRTGMRRSIIARPTRKVSYLQLVDHLSDAMTRGYTIGFRANGSSLKRESRRAVNADYKRRARSVLKEYGFSANAEIRRVYDNARAKGLSSAAAAKLAANRFNTLGHTAPVSNRLKTLYQSAIRAAHQQGLFDATRTDTAVWGYRFVAREVRGGKHPTTRDSHWQYHGVTLAKEDPFWQSVWPPLEWNCYCTIKVFRRKQKIVRPPPRPLPISAGFQGQGFELA